MKHIVHDRYMVHMCQESTCIDCWNKESFKLLQQNLWYQKNNNNNKWLNVNGCLLYEGKKSNSWSVTYIAVSLCTSVHVFLLWTKDFGASERGQKPVQLGKGQPVSSRDQQGNPDVWQEDDVDSVKVIIYKLPVLLFLIVCTLLLQLCRNVLINLLLSLRIP